jgi:hypothetical protein
MIIGKLAPFLLMFLLRRFCPFASGFHYSFPNSIFLPLGKAVSFASNP